MIPATVIEAVDHVGLAVADLDAAIEFQVRTFGLRLVHREENPDQDVVEVMLRPTGGGTEIQLLAPLGEHSVIARFLTRRGPGMHHVAYRVVDVDIAAKRLRAAGLRMLYPEAHRGARGSLINFVHPHDTGGVLTEIVQAGLHPSGGVQAGSERSGPTAATTVGYAREEPR